MSGKLVYYFIFDQPKNQNKTTIWWKPNIYVHDQHENKHKAGQCCILLWHSTEIWGICLFYSSQGHSAIFHKFSSCHYECTCL